MKTIKTFLKIKSLSSTNDALPNEVFFVNEKLYFKNNNNAIFELKTNNYYNMYGLIHGIRIKVENNQLLSSITDDKIERVLIIRTVNDNFEYEDTELVDEDTGLYFSLVPYLLNEKTNYNLNENISNVFPFSDFKTVQKRSPQGLKNYIEVPLFYKNKQILQHKDNNSFLYYLISKFEFDDFYPSESHRSFDGDYCSYIEIQSNWQEQELEADYSIYSNDYGRYGKPVPINENIWFGCLYYLYMIKTASFTPFKQVVDNYNPTFMSSDYDLSTVEQESDYTFGTLYAPLTLKTITLKNINTDNFHVGQRFTTLILLDGSQQLTIAPSIRNSIQNDLIYYINATVVSKQQKSITLDYGNNFTLQGSEGYSYGPVILFMKEIPSYSTIEKNTIQCLNNMNIDGFINLLPIYFSSQSSITDITPSNRITASPVNDVFSSINIELFLTKAYHNSTPIFSSAYTSLGYLQTHLIQNIVKITENTESEKIERSFYVNNVCLCENDNYTESNDYTVISCDNLNTFNWKKQSIQQISFDDFENNTRFVAGNLQGYSQDISTFNEIPYLAFKFIGTSNILSNDDNSSNKIKYGWNYITFFDLGRSLFDSQPSSTYKNNWLPFEDGYSYVFSKCVTRGVSYSFE